jgi:DNA-directed RNA polymerase subunit omega
MAMEHDTMINPPIEALLDKVDSKFSLVTLAARRARNINSYFNQLGDGLGHMIPPQVSSVARKPLSIGFEEIAENKIVWTEAPEEPEVDEIEFDPEAEAQAMADAAEAAADDGADAKA